MERRHETKKVILQKRSTPLYPQSQVDNSFRVVISDPDTWPDGSLGDVEPGEATSDFFGYPLSDDDEGYDY